MRKLVLGIIALVAVQFAFVTYTMLLKESAELMDGSLAVSQPVLTRPDLVRTEPVVEPTEIVPEPEKAIVRKPKTNHLAVTVPERTAKRQASSRARIAKPAFLPASADTASPGDFEPVVIRYNRKTRVLKCESREIPKTKKPTYIAKSSTPMIKKPWNWLKMIASKLN